MRVIRTLIGVLALIAPLVLPLAATSTVAQPAGRRPNIVLILTDDLDVASVDQMPNVVRLLRHQGTSFANSFVSTPLCCPARASLQRGQYVHNHGVETLGGPRGGFATFRRLGLEESTVGTWLQSAGYRTAMLGKYLNGYGHAADIDPAYVPPGWDEWAAVTNSKYVGAKLNENGTMVSYGADPADYLTDVLARKATDFVRTTAANGDPFFLYLAPTAPHGPATPAPRHAAAFADATAPRPPSYDEADVSDKPVWVQAWPRLSAAAVERGDELHRNRLRSLLAVDELVADLVETLRAAGTLDDTYVVFTSDNGFLYGQHRLVSMKHAPYTESIAVPLLVRGPGVVAGRVEDRMVLNLDLAPTFAELAGAATPGFVDGRSLVPLLTGDPPARWRQSVLVEYYSGAATVSPADGETTAAARDGAAPGMARAPMLPPSYRALRTTEVLYVEYVTGEREFYDLRVDPFELDNLAATTDPVEVDRLSTRLDELRRCAAIECQAAEDAPLDDDAPLAPVPLIRAPAADDRFGVGQPLTLGGSATDAAGRPLPDSALSWEVLLHEGVDTRPVLPPTEGNNLTLAAPASNRPALATSSYLEIRLTATDADGRRQRVRQVLRPRLVDVILATDPPGLALRINGLETTGPARVRAWEGSDLRVEAPGFQTVDDQPVDWAGWSDGGAAAHTIETPAATTTYTATFRPASARFAAEADSSTREDQPTNNFGAAGQLPIAGGRGTRAVGYLRFAVEGLAGAPVERATLRLFVLPGADAATQNGPAVYAAAAAWDEAGITWDDRPAPAAGPPVDDAGALPAGAWVEFDVTPLVPAEGNLTLLLATQSPDAVAFASRESRRPPELVIATAGGPAPPAGAPRTDPAPAASQPE